MMQAALNPNDEMKMINDPAAKSFVLWQLHTTRNSVRGTYAHGGVFVYAYGGSVGMGEHDDGVTRYYDRVLVHEELTARGRHLT